MNCEKIQHWLMTDYLDHELEEKKSLEVERHLKGCTACREVLGVVRKTASTPFKNVKSLQPDPVVWQQIQERIQTEEGRSTGWLEKLGSVFAPILKVPKPVYRVAFAALLIVAVITLTRWPSNGNTAYAYIEEQMIFLDELQAGNPDLFNGDLARYDVLFDEIQN